MTPEHARKIRNAMLILETVRDSLASVGNDLPLMQYQENAVDCAAEIERLIERNHAALFYPAERRVRGEI